MMSRRRRVAIALLLLTNATAAAAAAAAASVDSHSSASSSSSSIAKQHQQQERQLQQSTTYSNNKPITETQYQQCLSDILSADQNSDYELSPTEYIRFITFNSASNAYSYGYSAGQSTLNSMPLEFSMLFYTTACLCAYNTPTTASDVMSTEDMVEEGTPFCCAVDNAHVNIYAGPKYASGDGITERQDIYMREFCTEAFHSYEAAAAGSVTDAPVGQPTTPPPTLYPISSPVTMKPTLLPVTTPRPTFRPQTIRPTTSSPIPSTLPIKVTYGMSSDCGITAYDVMYPESTGNTIKVGLEAAMESVVVDILNSTWPRDDDGVGMGGVRIGEISSGGGGGEEQQQQSSSGELLFQMNIIPNSPQKVAVQTEEEEEEEQQLPHLIRYKELVPVGGDAGRGGRINNHKSSGGVNTINNSVESDPKGDNSHHPSVAFWALPEVQPRGGQNRKRDLLSSFSEERAQHPKTSPLTHHRKLVYYTLNNAQITDVQDSNNDQACPPGLNCMIVTAFVTVTLEPGDDPATVSTTIKTGLDESYQNGQFFQAIPEGTVLCPVTSSPSMMPTPSPTGGSSVVGGGGGLPSAMPTMEKSEINTAAPSSAATTNRPSVAPSAVETSLSSSNSPSVASSMTTMAPSSMSVGTMEPSSSSSASASPSGGGGSETTAPSSSSSGGTAAPSSAASGETASPSPSASGQTASPSSSASGETSSPSASASGETASPSPSSSASGGASASPSSVTSSSSMMPTSFKPTNDGVSPSAMPSSLSSQNGTDAVINAPSSSPSMSSSMTDGNSTSVLPTAMPSTAAPSAMNVSSSMGPSLSPITGDGTPSPSPSRATMMPSGGATVPGGSASPSVSSSAASSGGLSTIPTLLGQVTTDSPTAASSSSGTLQRLEIILNYDIQNQCGLDAAKVMNMENNTLKLGLIAATTNITIETLNATFPRVEEEEEIFQRYMRGFDASKYHSDVNNPNADYNNDIQHRSLVYLPDVSSGGLPPVTIDRILDIKSGCDQGSNCLLIISAVNVLLEAGDDENEIKKAVTNGLNDSWGDGSFNAAIPPDTVICPVTEEEAQGDSRLSVRLGSITFVDP